jgi:hypothetical protein
VKSSKEAENEEVIFKRRLFSKNPVYQLLREHLLTKDDFYAIRPTVPYNRRSQFQNQWISSLHLNQISSFEPTLLFTGCFSRRHGLLDDSRKQSRKLESYLWSPCSCSLARAYAD